MDSSNFRFQLHRKHLNTFNFIWPFLLFSQTGSWMYVMASRSLMFSMTEDPVLTAWVTAAAIAPVIVFGFFFGRVADRLGVLTGLRLSLIWMGFWSILTGLLDFFRILTPESLLLFSFMQGVGNAAYFSTWQATVGSLSNQGTLEQNIAKNSISFNVACIIGPIAGAQISSSFGYPTVFFLDAVSFFLFFIACVLITGSENHSAPEHVQFLSSSVTARALGSSLKMTLMIMFMTIIGGNALWSLLPTLANLYSPIEDDVYGKALSCLGVGALLWGILSLMPKALRFRKSLRRVAPLLLSLSMIILPLLESFDYFLITLLLSGFTWASLTTHFNSEMQRLSQLTNRAAVMALHGVIFNLAIFSNSLVWGYLIWMMGIRETFLFTAAWLLAAGWLVGKLKKGTEC